MALFGKKSEEEELANELVGGFLVSGKLLDLAGINGLKNKVDDNNEATAISEDLKNILKAKVKNGELTLDEIELYFYFMFKQAMYINQNLFFREGYCSNCNKDMEDDKYHIFSCPRCGQDFFDAYIIDYDELDQVEIKFPDDKKSPYRDLGDDLSNYIQKQKPNSNYEKVKKAIPKCLDVLGVSEEEYYLVEVVTKINAEKFSTIKLAIMAVYDDKFSFIPIADYYNDVGYKFYEDGEKDVFFETRVKFDEIVDINFPSEKYCRITMENNNVVLVQYLKTKTSLDKLANKLISFREAPQQEETVSVSGDVEETVEAAAEDTELPDGVNPMEKIKEAKELLDMGAISQEEFEEIKTKYMKFI